MDTFPDLGSLSDQELKDLIQQLTDEELEVSYRRRILHGKIDILRAELVNRLRKKHEGGEDVITGADVEQLTDILAGKVLRPTRAVAEPGDGGGVALHCPECGFVNAEGANYCQKCGAYLGSPSDRRSPDDRDLPASTRAGELKPVELEEVVARRRRAGHPLGRRARRGRASRSRATA